MIDLFADVAATDGNTEADRAIRTAKERGRTEERLKLAAEALPESLRPGGANPLAVLYNHYSRGIHGLTDEECLEVARELHFALVTFSKTGDFRCRMRPNSRPQLSIGATLPKRQKRWSEAA